MTIHIATLGSAMDHQSLRKQTPVFTAPSTEQGTCTGNHVGARARRAYKKFGLFRSASYPPYKLAFKSPFQQTLAVLAAAYLASTAGRAVKSTTGKSQIKQFREMHGLWFRHMVDPPSYYAQELFRPERLAKSSHFLTRFETKNGILKSINDLTKTPHAVNEMGDKAVFSTFCTAQGIACVETLAVVEKNDVTWHLEPNDLRFDLFCKRRKGKGAIGAEAFRFIETDRYCGSSGIVYTLSELVSHIRRNSDGQAVLVQRWLQNHQDIRDLAQDSLITFRVITSLNEDGEVEVTEAMLRVLAVLEPSWKSLIIDGEYGAPLDLTTGKLGVMTGDNMRSCCARYSHHPVTGAAVEGRRIPAWPAIAALAIRSHSAFRHRLMVGWDIALTPEGPVVLEGNTKFDVMFLQRVQNRPAGEARLGQLLAYHLQKLLPQKLV